jgi:hypothetical protein
MGYEFRGLDENNNMIIRIKNQEYKYKLHHVLEFSSARYFILRSKAIF